MASAADMRDELTCSICLNIYTDPVTLTCGHSFCRLCIEYILDTQEVTKYSCPECGETFEIKPNLKRNLRLCNIAECFKIAQQVNESIGIPCTYCIQSPVPAAKTCLHCEASLCEQHQKIHSKSTEHVFTEPTNAPGKMKCSVHKKVLEYCCCEDKACICVSCRLDGEHRGHQVETLTEASDKKKEKLRTILQKLTSDREDAEKRVESLWEFKVQMHEKAARETERVISLIRDIKEKLEALEKRVLSEISGQEEQLFQRVSDLIQQAQIKEDKLSMEIYHIKQLCNTTDPLTVLQKSESGRADYSEDEEEDDEATERHDIMVHDVGHLDVGLISVTLHSGLVGIVTGVMSHRHEQEAWDMLLDVNTAGDHLDVSGNLKNIFKSEINLRRPKNQGRFCNYPQVLSSSTLSSGQHYWEVEGSETGGWMVGMAYPSINRRGKYSLIGNNDKSWGVGRGWINNVYYVAHDLKETALPHSSSCQRLGIFLDYEAGRLSFYELCDPIKHLHTFSVTYTEPLHAVLGVYRDNTWVRI